MDDFALQRDERVGAITVISPHLDDAVYSTWNWLSRSSDVTIISVFAGVPPVNTQSAHYDLLTGSSDPVARARQRRAEDDAVCGAHGWRNIHLDFLDAPYREEADPGGLDAALRSVIPTGTRFVLGPSAIGSHVDHVATRDALLRVLSESEDHDLRLYADLPYAAYFGWPTWVTGGRVDEFLRIDAFYDRALSSITGWALDDRQVHLLESDQQRNKLRAVRSYETQFPAMESGPTRGLSPELLTW